MQVQLLPSSIINCRQCIALLLLSFSLHTSYGQKFFLYVDKDAHFSIPLPESWKRTEHVSAKVLLVAVGPIDTSLASGEGIRASVVKYDVQNNNEQSFWKNYKQGLRKKYSEFTSRGDGGLDGVHLDCSYAMFTYEDHGKSIKAIHYYFENEKGHFIVTASCAANNFALNRDTFDYMALNFSFEVNYQRLLDQE